MKLPGNKITNFAVAKTIGKASLYVDTLVTSPTVNKWSRWKPTHLKNWFHELSEAKLYLGRFGFKWDYNRTQLGQYGTTLVPTVFTEDYIKPDGDATKVIEETVENVRLFKRWWYETVPTKNDFNGSSDFGRPAGVVAVSNASPARLSDFANYDHASKPIIYSEKGLVKTDDGYTITLKISRPSDTYGGITPNDFQPDTGTEGATMTTWYIHMFAVSKEVITSSETTDKLYGFCETSDGLTTGTMIGWTSTEVTINIPEAYISHLLGEWYIFFAVGNNALAYEASADSWVLNDSGALAYPKLKADYVGKNVYPIEDMIYLHRVPDGEGLVFFEGSLEDNSLSQWPNESWYKDGELNPDFTEVFNPVNAEGEVVLFPIMEMAGYRGLGYFSGNPDEEATLYFVTTETEVGIQGTVSPLNVVKMLSKRAYRCLSLGFEDKDDLSNTQQYLDPQSSGYKGLLRDLPVMIKNTSTGEITQDPNYTASIFIHKEIGSPSTYTLYMRIYRDGTFYTDMRPITVAQSLNDTVRQYVFMNKVNGLTNQILGLTVTARIWNVSDQYNQGYKGVLQNLGELYVQSGDTVYTPYLPLYDDIVIGLPTDMQSEDTHAGGYGTGSAYFGGYLPVRYSIEQYYTDPN